MAQTPTIQDILSSYQEGVGAGGTNTALLLQALRNKGWQSRGKAGLNIYKARRDYLLAKRGNPDLKFMDFMSDPKTSAKYMTQGTDAIVTGESPAISLRETFGFGQPKSTQQSPYFGEDEIARQSKQAMRIAGYASKKAVKFYKPSPWRGESEQWRGKPEWYCAKFRSKRYLRRRTSTRSTESSW